MRNLNWILEVFENQLLHLDRQLGTLGWSLRKDLEMLAISHQQIYFIQILEDKKDSFGFFFLRILILSSHLMLEIFTLFCECHMIAREKVICKVHYQNNACFLTRPLKNRAINRNVREYFNNIKRPTFSN